MGLAVPHCPGQGCLGVEAGQCSIPTLSCLEKSPGQTLGLVSLVTKSCVVVFVSDAWGPTLSQVRRNPGRLARGACYLRGLMSRPVWDPCPTATGTQDAPRCFYLFSVSSPWTCANLGDISVLYSQPV